MPFFSLPLSDPLWPRLDYAHCGLDMAKEIKSLAKSWNKERAGMIFWDCLCHSGTLYGASYASVPHFLKLAQKDENRRQRDDIAPFLAFVVFSAFYNHQPQAALAQNIPLPGLPRTPEEWDEKRDCYRSMVKMLAGEKDRRKELAQYQAELDKAPIEESCLETIAKIERAFYDALPAIEKLCELSAREHSHDDGHVKHMLMGMAACRGHMELANFLDADFHGCKLQCSHCGQKFASASFDEQVGIYTLENDPPSNQDIPWQQMAEPGRADGFISLAKDREIGRDDFLARLLELARVTKQPMPALLLRTFFGVLDCPECQKSGPVMVSFY
jgi:hypothetical protein